MKGLNHDIDEVREEERKNGEMKEETKQTLQNPQTLNKSGNGNRVRRPEIDPLSLEHRAEKYYELFDENKKLQVYQNELNKAIDILKNKISILTDKVKKRQKLSGVAADKEFELIDDNSELKAENKKLRAIVKNLKSKSHWMAQENKPSNQPQLGYDQDKE